MRETDEYIAHAKACIEAEDWRSLEIMVESLAHTKTVQKDCIDNMAMLMRRLLHSPDNTLLHSKVREFLRRNGLDGSVIR